jgi:hypothetical protein
VYLIAPDGSRVTEAQFHQHRHALPSIVKKLDLQLFGHETSTYKLEPVPAFRVVIENS